MTMLRLTQGHRQSRPWPSCSSNYSMATVPQQQGWLAMHLDEWLLTPYRVAIHRPTRTAVVADIHLGYAEARCRRGDAVPQIAVETILQPLAEVREQFVVEKIVVAGDL